jgi:hypothetical protein
MKRLILIAVAAIVLSFGAGSVTAKAGDAPSWQDNIPQSSLTITFTEGWFESEVLELGNKCFKRCKKKCKRKYKRCKRKFGKKYCKNKKRKCKKKCRRRCRY